MVIVSLLYLLTGCKIRPCSAQIRKNPLLAELSKLSVLLKEIDSLTRKLVGLWELLKQTVSVREEN